MDASAFYTRLPRRKSNTFGKLCKQKQQQAGKEMGRSYGGACLNSACVHVWWDGRERKCGRLRLPGSAETSCVCCSRQQQRVKVEKKGELPPVMTGTASGFPLWPPCCAGEITFGFGMSSCRGICLTEQVFYTGCHPEEVWGNFKHACDTWVVDWLVLVRRMQVLSILPWSCAFSLCFQYWQRGKEFDNLGNSVAPEFVFPDSSFINLNWQVHSSETCLLPITATTMFLISKALVLLNRSFQDL